MKFNFLNSIHTIFQAVHGRMPKLVKKMVKRGLRPIRKLLHSLLKITYHNPHEYFNSISYQNPDHIPLLLNRNDLFEAEIQKGSKPFDSKKETLLLISHEDSRSGAPIVLLNLAQKWHHQYNIVFLLLYKGFAGSIKEYFMEAGSYVVGPMESRGDHVLLNALFEKLVTTFSFRFSIVNSIESYKVLPITSKYNLASVTLIHEFAAITRPHGLFHETLLWSTATVFSNTLTKENVFELYPELKKHHVHIIPQGACKIPYALYPDFETIMESQRILDILKPKGSTTRVKVILGIGTVTFRKGVDLFIQCAAAILRSNPVYDFRFVWIGKGYDPEDINYSAYLKEHIYRAGLQHHVFIIDEVANLELAYQHADVFLLCSRLDPFPNVAIDAMVHKLPLICFDCSTGLANILKENSLQNECVVPYLDVSIMAEKVIAILQSHVNAQSVGIQLHLIANSLFNFENYANKIEQIALQAVADAKQEKIDKIDISNSRLALIDYYLPDGSYKMEDIIRHYVRSYASNHFQRKLFPGFHPGIFKESCPSYKPGSDALVQYLKANKPSGRWRTKVITPQTMKQTVNTSLRIALHIHIYYIDLFTVILWRLNLNEVRPDLFITVPSNAVFLQVKETLANTYQGKICEIIIVPNKGRDIGPMLTALDYTLLKSYDIIGHIHTKKSMHVSDKNIGIAWYDFLLENLLGGKSAMADIILGCFSSDSSLGIVFPDDPHIIGWDRNLPYAISLATRLGISSLPDQIWFPIGTMFWARVKALEPLFSLRLTWDDYPEEPIPIDGTLLHAIERLLPIVASHAGFGFAVTNVEGVNR